MKLLILAAGYAIRLQPLTIDTPKPLLPIGNKAMIDWILDRAANLREIDAIYIVSNAKFFGKFESWQKKSKYAKNISLVNDGTMTNDTRLGAIKDLEIAIERNRIEDDLLVVAGDNLFGLDLNEFMKFAKAKANNISIALHDINDIQAAKKFGVLQIDDENAIIDFEEKPQAPKSTLVSTGIYYIPKGKISSIKLYVNSQAVRSDAPGNYISWMSKREKVYGFPFLEDWCDIGDIESYKRANEKYSERER